MRDANKPAAAQTGLSTVSEGLSEDALIEQSAIELFDESGWETADCEGDVTGLDIDVGDAAG